ncbi:MAG TPA: oligosaccharide flippase family protein, partial [Candidatus Limnocylindrales bacterium]
MSVEAEATVEPPVNAPPEAIRMRTIIGLSIWSLAGTAILAAYSLFLVGLVLHQLGPERFAPWAAAVALVGYLSLLDTGLTSTTTRDTARAAAGHADAVERVQAASTLFAFLAAAAGSFGLAASFVIPRILGLTGDPAATATAVAVILVVDLSVVLSTGGWLAILRGLQRYDLLFLGSLVHVTVGTCLTLALIGPLGIPGAATAQLGGRLVSRVVIAILVSRHAAWFHLRPRAVALRRIRDLWTFSIPIFAIQLATQIGVGTDIVVVGLTAGAVAVGLYAAGSQLVRNVSLFLGPTLSVLLPILSRFTVRGSGGTSSQLPTFVVMGGVLGGAIFGGMCLEASTIVQLWTGSQPQLT